MSAAVATRSKEVASFRTRLFTAIMVIVATLTALGFYLAQRRVTADAERNLQQTFQTELSSMHKIEELRYAALADRSNTLVAKPRIHAAIEDDAIDLLYPTAKDELRDLMEGEEPPPEQAARSLHARFYRFLDDTGAVIKPPNPSDVGELDAATEAQLSLRKLPDTRQIGYIQSAGDIHEVIAVPIFSTDTGDLVSALVIGFKPLELENKTTGMQSGVWVDGHLHLPALAPSAQSSLNEKITPALANSDSEQNYFRVEVAGAPQLLFHKRLNPGSLFPPAYEIFLYPLASWTAQLDRLRWQIGARRRASVVRRIRRKPFRGAQHVRAREETGARFGRKSRRTRTRRGRAGIHRRGTGAIHQIFSRCVTPAEKPNDSPSDWSRITAGTRRI